MEILEKSLAVLTAIVLIVLAVVEAMVFETYYCGLLVVVILIILIALVIRNKALSHITGKEQENEHSS